jgi:phage protein D
MKLPRRSVVNTRLHHAILVIGQEDPIEATLAEVERYGEVFVVARAVHDAHEGWLVDDDRNRASARRRLERTLTRLRAHGVRAVGVVGDADARAAEADARALFSAGADATFA